LRWRIDAIAPTVVGMRPLRPRPGAGAALLVLMLLVVSQVATAAGKKPFTATPGPSRSSATFTARYEGSGAYKTRFHATPPNQGGKPDINDAWDSSAQKWKITYRGGVTVPACGPPADGSADPCASLSGPTTAKGTAELVGHVRHKHVDGLYRQLDRSVKCTLRKRPSTRRVLDASVVLRYIPETNSIGVTVTDPLATTESLFPGQCPKQGESIDRILDFYAMPGFSFSDAYGPARFFESREVVIPVAVFHRSAKIRIPLHGAAAGRPPKHCAVHDPSFERCTTGGSWHGVLTLTAKGTK
jgi:hypothetical protein